MEATVTHIHLTRPTKGQGPSLQTQLYNALMQQIVRGQLRPGLKLPAHRELAKELGVSRNTVVAVIDQLKVEGYLESRLGSGVFIKSVVPEQPLGSSIQAPTRETIQASIQETIQADTGWPAGHEIESTLGDYGQFLFNQVVPDNDANRPLTPGLPDVEAFPTQIWRRLLSRHGDRPNLLGYNGVQGYPPLRKAIADYLGSSRGVRCTPEQIIITQGAQQALSLCGQIFLNPGDSVLVENPGYTGAHKAFSQQGQNLLPLPLINHHLDTQFLMQQQSPEYQQAKLLYTCPTHQYPMGGILPAQDRLNLLQWARDHQTWIIEDDYDSEFHFYHRPIAAIQGMAANTPVIYMGSFSKTMFPGLRLGFLVVPIPLVDTFIRAKNFMTGESPLPIQATTADFIQEGHFSRHLRRMRNRYRVKWELARQLCQQHLGHLADTLAESAGMHLVVEIPDVDDKQLQRDLASAGFGSSPLSKYFLPGAPSRTGLVLGFACANEAEIEAGILQVQQLCEAQLAAKPRK